MKRILTLAAVATLCAVVAGGVYAQDARPKGDKPKPDKAKKEGAATKPKPLPGAYGMMHKAVEFTPAQQEKIRLLVDKREADLKAWDEQHKAKADELKANVEKAGEDRAAKKKASDELKALMAQREEITKKSSDDVMAVMTPEQKAKWDLHTLSQAALNKYRQAKLTDEQLKRAQTKLAELAAGKDIGVEKKDVRDDLAKQLQAYVEKEVLTDDQRAALQSASKPAKPERPAKGNKDAPAKGPAAN